jgi:carbon storage regulator CsrA
MLVLSRSEGEGITFPDMDLKVQVLRITGNRVQVGIDAAPKIRALRSELASSDLGQKYARTTNNKLGKTQACCELQSQINALQQTLDIAQQQLDRGELKRAESTLEQVNVAANVTKVSEPAPSYSTKQPITVLAAEQHLAC